MNKRYIVIYHWFDTQLDDFITAVYGVFKSKAAAEMACILCADYAGHQPKYRNDIVAVETP